MSASKASAIIAISFLVSSLIIYSPMLIDWSNRSQKEQVAKVHLAALRNELYAPQGVTLLSETKYIRPVNYFNDCFGADTEIIYGSNRPRSEIRMEYAHGLIKAEWEQDPDYESVDYYQFYKKGDDSYLSINTSDTVRHPTEQYFQVIYSLWLTWITPFYRACNG